MAKLASKKAEIEELKSLIKLQIKRKNNSSEYFQYKDYIVDGKHCGWEVLVPGVDEDFYIVLGDEEKELDIEYNENINDIVLAPKDKKQMKEIVENIKDKRPNPIEPEPYSGPLKANDGMPIKNKLIVKPIEKPIEEITIERLFQLRAKAEEEFSDYHKEIWLGANGKPLGQE